MSAYSGIYSDLNGLSQLRARAERRPEAAIEQAATQFEALFTRMMLKSMRESSLGDSLFDSSQQKQYLEMFDNQIAIEMSRGSGLGLKEILIRQLGGEQASASAAAGPVAPPATAGSPRQDWQPESKQDFIDQLLPLARKVERELGISHDAVLAHAALESGWGRHTMRRPDGSDAFNLFGIKADASWRGDRVQVGTVEVRDGIARRETASFRAYDSLAEAVDDYASFLTANPRYRDALANGAEPAAYAQALQDAGYATDPDYAAKLTRIAATTGADHEY